MERQMGRGTGMSAAMMGCVIGIVVTTLCVVPVVAVLAGDGRWR
jgi:flagellar motor component MotA